MRAVTLAALCLGAAMLVWAWPLPAVLSFLVAGLLILWLNWHRLLRWLELTEEADSRCGTSQRMFDDYLSTIQAIDHDARRYRGIS